MEVRTMATANADEDEMTEKMKRDRGMGVTK